MSIQLFCKISWLRHDIGTFNALLIFCQGYRLVTGGFPSQRASNLEHLIFFLCKPEQTVEQTSSCRWSETPWSYMMSLSCQKRSGACFYTLRLKMKPIRKNIYDMHTMQLQRCRADQSRKVSSGVFRRSINTTGEGIEMSKKRTLWNSTYMYQSPDHTNGIRNDGDGSGPAQDGFWYLKNKSDVKRRKTAKISIWRQIVNTLEVSDHIPIPINRGECLPHP